MSPYEAMAAIFGMAAVCALLFLVAGDDER